MFVNKRKAKKNNEFAFFLILIAFVVYPCLNNCLQHCLRLTKIHFPKSDKIYHILCTNQQTDNQTMTLNHSTFSNGFSIKFSYQNDGMVPFKRAILSEFEAQCSISDNGNYGTELILNVKFIWILSYSNYSNCSRPNFGEHDFRWNRNVLFSERILMVDLLIWNKSFFFHFPELWVPHTKMFHISFTFDIRYPPKCVSVHQFEWV